MATDRDELIAMLTWDLTYLYEEGLDPSLDKSEVPDLVALAETLLEGGSDNEDASWTEIVAALLYRATTEMDEKRREGITTLLGIGDDDAHRTLEVTFRRNEAAPQLGYSSGDSLRQTKKHGRRVTDLLLEELVGYLVDLAEQHPDYRYILRTNRDVQLSALPTRYEDLLRYERRNFEIDIENLVPFTLRIYLDTLELYGKTLEWDWALVYMTHLRVALPTTASDRQQVVGHIFVGNTLLATGATSIFGTEPFLVSYAPGSAKLGAEYITNFAVDDRIVGVGAHIGPVMMESFLHTCLDPSFAITVELELRLKRPLPPPPEELHYLMREQ